MTFIDETKALLDFLLAQSTLTSGSTSFQTRIWAGTDVPEAGYTPATGIALCFKVRGGLDDDEEGAVQDPSFQVKVYGKDDIEAKRGALLLHNAIQDKGNRQILAIRREEQPVPLQEPETAWTYVLVFYKVMVRQS